MNSLCSKHQNSEFEFPEMCNFYVVFQFYGKMMFPEEWIQVMHFWQESQSSNAVFFFIISGGTSYQFVPVLTMLAIEF